MVGIAPTTLCLKGAESMVNYRKIYKDYYRLEFNNEFDVHHIDRDRSNNDIHNLILLPQKLHHEYHMVIDKNFSLIEMWGYEKFPFDLVNIDMHGKVIKEIFDINQKIVPWVKSKEYLEYAFFYRIDGWKTMKVQIRNNIPNIECIPNMGILGYSYSYRGRDNKKQTV